MNLLSSKGCELLQGVMMQYGPFTCGFMPLLLFIAVFPMVDCTPPGLLFALVSKFCDDWLCWENGCCVKFIVVVLSSNNVRFGVEEERIEIVDGFAVIDDDDNSDVVGGYGMVVLLRFDFAEVDIS